MFDTDYVEQCEQKAPESIRVNRFHGESGNPNEFGITRRGGVLALGVPNARASQQATFRGKELIRRVNSR